MKLSLFVRRAVFYCCCCIALFLPFDFSLENLGLTIPAIKSFFALEVVILIILWEIAILSNRENVPNGGGLVYPFIVFLGIHLFSSVIPSEKMIWSLKYTARFFGLGIVAFAIINFITSERRLERLISCVFAGACIASVFVAAQYFRHDAIDGLRRFFESAEVSSHRICGLFGWPTNMSVFFGALVPLAACFWIFRPHSSVFRRAVYGSLTVLFIFCAVLSGTKGWLIGLFFAFACFVAIFAVQYRKPKIIALFFLLCGIIVSAFLFNLFGFRSFTTGTLEPTEKIRLEYAKSALRSIQEYPFRGQGADMFFWKNVPRFRTHNIFLETTVNLGFFGLLALLWLYGAVMRKLYKGIRASDGFGQTYITLGILCSLAGFLGHGLVDYFWSQSEIAGLFWVLVGAGVASTACEQRSAEEGK
ncbi:MAG: O-antigen ligase family protein [Candidatus Omnitrophota bacterium]